MNEKLPGSKGGLTQNIFLKYTIINFVYEIQIRD
jgi:hypothetical protein